MGPGPAPDRDRLADVEHSPGAVAEEVHAGVARKLGEIELGQRLGGQRPPPRRGAPTALRGQQGQRLTDRAGVGAQPRVERAENPGTGLSVGERPVGHLDLDAERLGEGAEAPLALQGQQRPGQRRCAEHRPLEPTETDPGERLTQHAPVKGSVVGDQRPAREYRLQDRQHGLRGRCLLEHLLGYPGEPADAAAQGRARSHERGPAIVELTAANQDHSDLDQLARVAAQAVGLGVDDHELGRGQALFEQFQAGGDTPWPGRDASRRAGDALKAGVLDVHASG